MPESAFGQPQISVNGRSLTPAEIGTVVAGLNAIGRIANEREATASAPTFTGRDAQIEQHRRLAVELRELILGEELRSSSKLGDSNQRALKQHVTRMLPEAGNRRAVRCRCVAHRMG